MNASKMTVDDAAGRVGVSEFVEQMRTALLPVAEHIVRVEPADDELVDEMTAAFGILSKACCASERAAFRGLDSLLFPGGHAERGEFVDLIWTLEQLGSAWETFDARCSSKSWEYVWELGQHVSSLLDPLTGYELLLAKNRTLHVLLNWSTDIVISLGRATAASLEDR